MSTPLKKRRFTADAISSDSSSTLLEDSGMADKPTTWSAVDDHFESRRRLLASRNLFEVRSCVFLVSFSCGSIVTATNNDDPKQ